MTRREIAAFLKECGSDEPQSEVKVILEELFGVSAAAQMCSPDRDYDSEKLRELLTRRKAREPLQYILGYAYFCSEKYLLNDACLIPRADTELLVSKAAELLPEGAVIADLCTGSGCIAISLLSMRPDIKAVATDISERAVQAAQNNALLNGISDRLHLFVCDIFTHPLKDSKFDAVISNPPYIPTSVVKKLSPEVLHEPQIALDGGEDGMCFYSFILKNYTENLKQNGFFAFEIGYDQEDSIKTEAEAYGMGCEIFYDMSGNPRVAIIKPKV